MKKYWCLVYCASKPPVRMVYKQLLEAVESLAKGVRWNENHDKALPCQYQGLNRDDEQRILLKQTASVASGSKKDA